MLLFLFDMYVFSLFNYGCEIWGCYNVNDIEKLY